MAKDGAVTLRGGFRPGTRVRLIEVDGPGVLRPPDGAKSVDEQEVDENGCVEFTGLEVGGRYFATAIDRDGYRAVRLTARAKDDPNTILDSGGVQPERQKLTDGTWLDEPPEREKPALEGATWLAQHQVPEGTILRSDTPRGAAHPISREELERIGREHRKQEPTEPIVELAEDSEDPETAPARTSKPAAKTPAKSTKKGA